MTARLCLVLVLLLPLLASSVVQQVGKRVVVFGATGRVGRLVINELLSRQNSTLSVRCVVRDVSKAEKLLPTTNPRLEVVQGNIEKEGSLEELCRGADGAIWTATGFSDASSNVNKVLGLLKLKFSPASVIDVKGLKRIGELLADRDGIVQGGPTLVVCSSAGVTRPTWSVAKKQRLVGAADIPIVRLNPLNILDVKRSGEEALRAAMSKTKRYAIVRPCGLNDKCPPGRALLSQGDVAVGRICKPDAAKLLVDTLFEPAACGRTFEALALPGFESPSSLDDQLRRLKLDSEPPADEDALFAVYSLLQQIVPGETMRPNQLAMGQSYEQLDRGETGRLGERGSESAPITRS